MENNFSLARNWYDWSIKTLVLLGAFFVVKNVVEIKPWQGIIVGYSKATEEIASADPINNEDVADRFKRPPKPLAWAK